MDIKQETTNARGIKFFIEDGGQEIARAYLYIFKNDLHKEPFGFMEDVFVAEEYRSQGLGTKLVKKVIETAKQNNCYKLVATSRHERSKVHDLYERLGFKDWGKEYRIDF
ncbi:MAG: GNAT family N-acetyltransferase [Parcubacteria group bacterium CG1_02_44_65]|nr:MAG: GNAT family N-acetyltransferase [Parcubacteria group bacterium CG1_02_44_65]